MTVHDFSFAANANDFDRHIRDSIPGYRELCDMCTWLSRDFVQDGTTVVDIGCTTGSLLRAIRDQNQASRPGAMYVGIDTEPKFGESWRRRRAGNVRFEARDARSFDGFKDLSLACDLFTLQFIPLRDRVPLLRRVHGGLVEGGALIIAAKVLANDAWSQDMLTAHYHAHKRRRGLGDGHILDKTLSLRGQMVLWDEAQMVSALRDAGFEGVHRFWQSYLFVAHVARKSMPVSSRAASDAIGTTVTPVMRRPLHRGRLRSRAV
jgi:tRNA (cmo5U34)-methyltransferase